MNNLAIITSASVNTGSGHVMRQLALAEKALERDFIVQFYTDTDFAADLIKNSGFQVVRYINSKRSQDLLNFLKTNQTTHLIIDVHESLFLKFKEIAAFYQTMLVVSPVGFDFEPFGNEIVHIGKNMGAWMKIVSASDVAINIASGRAWTVFRSEFAGQEEDIERDNSILICHGGSDPASLTLKSMRALELSEKIYEVNILAGAGFTDLKEIKRLADKSKHSCRIIKGELLPSRWMRKAVLAIINGGNIRYELCLTGTPYLALSINERQYNYSDELARLGAGINLGVHDTLDLQAIAIAIDEIMLDDELRQKMILDMSKLFDMNGSDRMLDLVTGHLDYAFESLSKET